MEDQKILQGGTLLVFFDEIQIKLEVLAGCGNSVGHFNYEAKTRALRSVVWGKSVNDLNKGQPMSSKFLTLANSF